MKAEPLKVSIDNPGYTRCDPREATHLRLNVPGPLSMRIIPVRDSKVTWKWNGDINSPTLHPSILTKGEDKRGKHVCHSFVKDGKIKFLSDCSHEYAGKTLDLLEID